MSERGTQLTTANEILQDRGVRHLLFLTRHQSHEAARIRTLLQAVHRDVLGQLEGRLARIERFGLDRGPATTRRLARMFTALDKVVNTGYGDLTPALRESLDALARQEAEWQAGLLDEAMPVEWEVTLPSAEQLRAAVRSQPFDGKLLREWFSELTQRQKSDLRQAIRLGVAEGQTVSQIMQRIRGTRAGRFRDGILEISARRAEAVVRTAVLHVSNHARQQLYRENEDLVKGVQWVATLDARTCPECMVLDGRVFDLDKGPRPPRHLQCRCSSIPVLRSWKELGIDLSEAPAGTRASLDGQVPAKLTYNGWLRRQVRAGRMDLVVEALGPARAKLFAAGGLSVQQFTDRRGRILTLQQLREKEADVFRRLNLAA